MVVKPGVWLYLSSALQRLSTGCFVDDAAALLACLLAMSYRVPRLGGSPGASRVAVGPCMYGWLILTRRDACHIAGGSDQGSKDATLRCERCRRDAKGKVIFIGEYIGGYLILPTYCLRACTTLAQIHAAA